MRKMLMLLVAVGCAGDDGKPDPHELVDCVNYPVSADGCEAPCADYHATMMTVACPAHGQNCITGVIVDGVTGCCLPHDESTPGDPVSVIRWDLCD